VNDDRSSPEHVLAAAWLEELDLPECVSLLRASDFGRIAFMTDEGPIVVPVNYRLVETSGRTWIALRTRPGNVIDRAPLQVAFELDGVDPFRQQGWSVLVRGTLHQVDPDAAEFRERFDPHPWITADRHAWLIVDPFAITGRRLHAAETEWAFHPEGYL
jgi:nitroimidazol reductase NimA-like FMN-containing flavoprotein (pyridoxamine 5'-phosphate oxidase superfamily)